MGKLTIYFLVIVVLCQTAAVFSRHMDLNQVSDTHQVLQRQVRQAGTTTTVPPPTFTRCVNACNNRVTPQYNPVCGSNGQSYTNRKRLECAQQCGLSVTESHVGTCGPSAGGK